MNRRQLLLILAVVALVGFAGCLDAGDDIGATDDSPDDTGATNDVPSDDTEDAGEGDDSTTEPDGTLSFHHIDVGQADATLIVTPTNETILIDTGDWRQDGSIVLEYLDQLNIDRIDHLVATHAHADHIGGHAAIIEEFESNRDGIGNIYDSGVAHTSQTYENYLDAVDDHGHELLIVEEGDSLPLDSDSVTATVLNPPAGESGSDLHENSVTLVFEFGDIRYLTTGDAEAETETRLVDEWAAELAADIYHAGHHGSTTSSTESFMDAVDPDISVISSAFDSQYGHPHDEVLDRFAEMGIETYWTGVHEDIVVRTDGDSVSVDPAVEESTDAASLKELKHSDAVNAIGTPMRLHSTAPLAVPEPPATTSLPTAVATG